MRRHVLKIWRRNAFHAGRVFASPYMFSFRTCHGVSHLEYDDSALDDFESKVLNDCVSAVEVEVAGSLSNDGNEADSQSLLEQRHLTTFDAAHAMQSVLDMLPLDGSRVPLTSIASWEVTESIVTAYGSLIQFLRLYPDSITLHKIEEEGSSRVRWYVCRRHILAKATMEVHGGVESTNARPQHKADRSIQKRRLVSVESTTPEAEEVAHEVGNVVSDSDAHTLVKEIAHCVTMGASNVFSVRSALAERLPNIMEGIESKGFTLRTLLQTHPVLLQSVTLTVGGGIHMTATEGIIKSTARKVSTSSLSAHRKPLIIQKDAEFEDSWEVDLDLDSPDPSVVPAQMGSNDEEPEQDTASTAALPTSPRHPLPHGAIPHVPPPNFTSSVRRMTPPSHQRRGDDSLKQHRPPSAFSSPPKVEMNTGRLIDHLMEVVPTFPVLLSRVRSSDALCKALGHIPVQALLRRLPNIFCVDSEKRTVMIQKAFIHPLKGKGDHWYPQEDASSTASNAAVHDGRLVLPVKSSLPTSDTMKSMRNDVSSLLGGSGGSGVKSSTITFESYPKTPAVDITKVLSQQPDAQLLWTLSTVEWSSFTTLREKHPSLLSFLVANWDALCQGHVLHVRGEANSREVRLRHLLASPSATHDFRSKDSAIISKVVYQRVVKSLRPLWMPLDKWITRLEPDIVNELTMCAKTANAPSADNACAPNHNMIAEVLAMHAGRDIWLSQPLGKPNQIRRYFAVEEMDDVSHFAIPLLHNSLTVSAVPVRLVEHVRKLPFAHTLLLEEADLEQVIERIQKHKSKFVVVKSKSGDPNEATICRFSPFHVGGSVAATGSADNVLQSAKSTTSSWGSILDKKRQASL